MNTVTLTFRDGTSRTHQAASVSYTGECIEIHEPSMAMVIYHWSAVACLRVEPPSA